MVICQSICDCTASQGRFNLGKRVTCRALSTNPPCLMAENPRAALATLFPRAWCFHAACSEQHGAATLEAKGAG